MSLDGAHSQRNLDVRFAGGVAWTAGAKWTIQIFSWTSVFITARLLTKSDFGISEMSAYFFLLTNLLAEFGVGTAVLQIQELDRRALAQLHTFSCLLCTFAYIASLPAAPLLARFFHNEHLTRLIIVNNLAFFLTGFQAVPMGLLQRDMDYRRLSFAEAAQALVQSIGTITSAWFGLGYWSMMVGGGLGKLTAVVLASCWKPIPFALPRWKDIRAPIRLGRQAAIGRLAWACYTQADGIVVGRVLGESVLGTYRMAMNFATAPAEKLSTLIMRAAGPLFAKVQNDADQVRRYFRILVEVLTMIELPLMLGLGMVAPDAVRLILGSEWMGVVTPLRWLVLFMTLRTLGTLTEQILISQRRTAFTMRISLLNLIVMPIALYAGAGWKGTGGVAATWVMLAPLTIGPLIWKASRLTRTSFGEFASALLPAVTSTAAMLVALFLLRGWLDTKAFPVAVRLILQIAAGGAVYGGVLLGLFRQRVFRYVRFMRDARREKTSFTPAPEPA